MAASRQQLEVVAGSWEPVVHRPKEDLKGMEVARLGAKDCRHFHTQAAPEVVVSHEASWGIQGSCCACLRHTQHWPLVELAAVEQLVLFASRALQLAAVVAHLARESVTKS